MSVEAKVVEVARARGLTLVACDMISGEAEPTMRLAVPGKAGIWTIVSTAPVKPHLYEKGRRGLTLSPSEPDQELLIGDFLVGQ